MISFALLIKPLSIYSSAFRILAGKDVDFRIIIKIMIRTTHDVTMAYFIAVKSFLL
jgi:hypothetical protein